MKVIHINSYYVTRPLHSYLVSELDKQLESQIVYIPISNNNLIDKFRVYNLVNTRFVYSKAFNPLLRFLWPFKIMMILSDIKKKLKEDIHKGTIFHAHSLFVNGLIALYFCKKYDLKYYVSVRSTDFNAFIRRFFLFKIIGYKIMTNASGILFLSPGYMNNHLKAIYGEKKFKGLKQKSFLIPNGLNSSWFKSSLRGKLCSTDQINLIFVGCVDRNKNLSTLLNACEVLSNETRLSLKVIGDGPELNSYKMKKYSFDIELLGWIEDDNVLREHYSNSDIFVLPSIYESFGLVYIEAMSQGLPVIYSANQGIDGYFEQGEVGYSIDPNQPLDIIQKIKLIVRDYDRISKNAYEKSRMFTWSSTAQNLKEIYFNSTDSN